MAQPTYSILVHPNGAVTRVASPNSPKEAFSWMRGVLDDTLAFVATEGASDAQKIALFVGANAQKKGLPENTHVAALLERLSRKCETKVYGIVILVTYVDYLQYGLSAHTVDHIMSTQYTALTTLPK